MPAYSGSLGVADLMAADIGSREELAALQREDLAAVGRSLLLVACAGAPMPSLDLCAAGFSPALTRTLSGLLASPQGSPLGSWQQVGESRRTPCSCITLLLVLVTASVSLRRSCSAHADRKVGLILTS